MKSKLFIILSACLVLNKIPAQNISDKNYFNIIDNAENLKGSSEANIGMTLRFELNNKDSKIGNGRGWMIYKDGSLYLDSIVNILYPKAKLKGYTFIKELFINKCVLFNSDTITTTDFNIYFYSVGPKYLELRKNTDGEGADITYSYYEKYPCDINLYKMKAGDSYFEIINSYEVNDEDEYITAISNISNYMKSTYINSNNP